MGRYRAEIRWIPQAGTEYSIEPWQNGRIWAPIRPRVRNTPDAFLRGTGEAPALPTSLARPSESNPRCVAQRCAESRHGGSQASEPIARPGSRETISPVHTTFRLNAF